MNEIQTTLGALVQAEPALTRLLAICFRIEPGAKQTETTNFKLRELMKLVREKVQLYREQRDALIKELGAPREPTAAETALGMQGPVTEVTPANRAAFFARAAELDAIQIPLPWTPRLSDLDGIAVSSADLLALEPLLTEQTAG